VDTHPLSRRPASTSPRCFPSVGALSGLMPALAFGLVLSLFPPSLSAQERTVSGVVTDARTLAPVAGAQVSIEGTGVGGLTDAGGRFRVSGIPGGGESVTVRVQFIGYQTATQVVRVGDTAIRITLSQAAIELDALVVTGTAGAVQRRAIGNLVTQIDAASVTEIAPIPDVGMLLNARAPGVVVQPGSGMLGGGSRIRIRGASSFSLNDQPLIYVDGVRMNNEVNSGPAIQGFGGAPITRLSDLNPADIESIEVIKGPAAATLYGTEASNGVIQIITKKGVVGDRPRINVMMRQGATWFGNDENRINSGFYRDESGDLQEFNLVRQEKERGTPIWTTGHLQGAGVDVSGGNAAVRYFVSAVYDHDNGIEPTNRVRRLSTRVNLAFQPHSSMDVSTNMGLMSSTIHLARENNGGTWFNTRLGSPVSRNATRRGFWSVPPEATWSAFEDFQEARRFTVGVQMNHRPFSWLTQRATIGTDLTFENNQQIVPRMSEYNAQFFSAAAAAGSKSVVRRDVTNTTVDYGLTAAFDLNESLNSSTSAGFQYYRKYFDVASANGREFPAPGLTAVDALAVNFGGNNSEENITAGVYLQQQVSWRNRVFLTGAVRADDNSAFGENFELVYYPKFSGSWVVNEEEWFSIDAVDNFRLRFAYGASGQQPETFAALRTFQPITTGVGGAALTPAFIGNPDLAPERGRELEVGFETSLLDQRLGLDFTYYNQRTRDAILLRQQPPSQGFPGSQFVNAGEIANQGVEVQVSTTPVRRQGLDLTTQFNLSWNENEVIDLGGDEFISLGTQQHRVGFPIAGWFERKVVSADVDSQGRPVNVLCDGGTGRQGLEQGGAAVPCAQAPRVYLGPSQPRWEGSVASTLTLWDRISLYGLVDFKLGQYKDATESNGRCVTRRICYENFFPEQFPIFNAEVVDPNIFPTNLRIRDASFAKLREVSASVQLPESWAGRVGASRASVRIAARNLFIWSDWPLADPESFRLNNLHLRSEQEAMPQLHQFVTTINFTF
jgi:TonB-linked SusC/RagA family outer membrane protein